MAKHLTRAAAAGLLALSIVSGASRCALAADDCVTEPNRPAGPGGHWYFHTDRATDRKCWYLVEPQASAPAPESPQAPPQPTPASPSLNAFFSALSAGLPGASSGPQAAAPSPSPASTQADPNAAHRPDSEAAPAVKLPRVAPARATVAQTDEGTAASADQQERDALFQEFLRWRERQ